MGILGGGSGEGAITTLLHFIQFCLDFSEGKTTLFPLTSV